MSTGKNPYEAPRSDGEAIGVRSGLPSDLKSVATYQKGILVCILVYLACVIAQFFLPPDARQILLVVIVLVGLASTVFVFLLAIKVYNLGLGILMGVLTMVPCLGLIVLLLVNQKATTILKANGHKVGLLGADLSEF